MSRWIFDATAARAGLLMLLVVPAACRHGAGASQLDRVARVDFNREAAQLALPLFWSEDADADGAIDPAELSALWGVCRGPCPRSGWVEGDAFTPAFLAAYACVSEAAHRTVPTPTDAESRRRAAVRAELAHGRPTLLESDFSTADTGEQDRAIVRHVLDAAEQIERIYLAQRGAAGMLSRVPAGDPASRMLFYRNQGPWCTAPRTESDPDCGALADKPAPLSGLYPSDIQKDGFCEALAQEPNQAALLDHFSVVRRAEDGKLQGVPYTTAYRTEMEAIANSLEAAADAIQTDDEAAFISYLRAAAQAFRDNDWKPADEAWSRMNVHNSRWYLRIAPDEVYFEPCRMKAGFHVSFGRINQGSLEWQRKLDPVKNEMEKTLAALAGPPYEAREVSFHMPDFVDIVLNAGDSRSPLGATIGQSLPNWGPVANEGRGRTVAMTNFYTDADSKAAARARVDSLLCPDTVAEYTDDPAPQIMSTVLHEAAHNLGPSHEYRVNGKTDEEAFGGGLAAVYEELKAQTSALFFTDWLVEQKLIEAQMARRAHTRDMIWTFGQISRGMVSASGRPKPYGQLAAIQLGFLSDKGAVTWTKDRKAANGRDDGCFSFQLDEFRPAIDELMRIVARIKAQGDREAAEALRAKYVDGDTALLDTVTERWLRASKASFVYSVRL